MAKITMWSVMSATVSVMSATTLSRYDILTKQNFFMIIIGIVHYHFRIHMHGLFFVKIKKSQESEHESNFEL
jgi:hypothetical protein